SLALGRQSVSASGARGRTWDVGPLESESVQLIEVDGEGRRARSDIFAANRLSDAVVRLYERYAELLPDGPERERAAATARSVAVFPSFEPERFATVYAPAIEFVDHRALRTHAAHGAEAALQHLRAWLDLADDIVVHDGDVLRLQPDALLMRRTLS